MDIPIDKLLSALYEQREQIKNNAFTTRCSDYAAYTLAFGVVAGLTRAIEALDSAQHHDDERTL